jgi:GrpB-like predicted nucleotidyltransferase (UPF0157 family)
MQSGGDWLSRVFYFLLLALIAPAAAAANHAFAQPVTPEAAVDAGRKAQEARLFLDTWLRAHPDRWREASRLAKEASQLDPNNADAWVVRSRLELSIARGAEGAKFDRHRRLAYEYAERALKLDPDNAEGLRIMGRMKQLDKEHDQARSYLDRAAKVHGLWPALAYNYAMLEQSLAAEREEAKPYHAPAAIAWHERVLQLARTAEAADPGKSKDPAHANAFSESSRALAWYAQSKGDKARAAQHVHEALAKAHPLDVHGIADAAKIHLHLDDYAEAERLARIAMERYPKGWGPNYLAAALIMQAWQAYMAGDKVQGSRLLDEALSVPAAALALQRELKAGTPNMRAAAQAYSWRLQFKFWKQRLMAIWRDIRGATEQSQPAPIGSSES